MVSSHGTGQHRHKTFPHLQQELPSNAATQQWANSEPLTEFLCARHCSKLFKCISSSTTHYDSTSDVGLVIVPVTQMRKLRHRVIKWSLIHLSPTISNPQTFPVPCLSHPWQSVIRDAIYSFRFLPDNCCTLLTALFQLSFSNISRIKYLKILFCSR